MKKVILGGGLIALLARDILGPDWFILPMGRSLHYSWNPPLADNYVIKDQVIDDYMNKFALIPIYTKAAYSIGGQLTYNHHIAQSAWLNKVYGFEVPGQAPGYWRENMEYFAYGDCVEIYQRLQKQYLSELTDNNTLGKAVSIKDHVITTDVGKSIEFDEMISTIPLYALLPMIGMNVDLPSKDVWFYHLRTKFDFEGNKHMFVADPEIEFFKVTQCDPVNHVFWCTEKIEQPGKYFMSFLKDFEPMGETQVTRDIPCGPIPEFKRVSDAGITCFGSAAVWDDCLDVGSCIKRLLRKANADARQA